MLDMEYRTWLFIPSSRSVAFIPKEKAEIHFLFKYNFLNNQTVHDYKKYFLF